MVAKNSRDVIGILESRGVGKNWIRDHISDIEAAKNRLVEQIVEHAYQEGVVEEQVDGITLPHVRHAAVAPPSMAGAGVSGIVKKQAHFKPDFSAENAPANFVSNGQSAAPTLVAMTSEQFNTLLTRKSEGKAVSERHIKGAKLPLFSQTPTTNTGLDVEDWLRMAEDTIKLEKIQEDDKVLWVTTHLSGAAKRWWLNVSKSTPAEQWGWYAFVSEMKKQFVSPLRNSFARRELRNIKQGNRSMTAYAQHFRNLVNRVDDMSEADKMENFMDGMANGELRQFLGVKVMENTAWNCEELVRMAEWYSGADKYASYPSAQRGRGGMQGDRGTQYTPNAPRAPNGGYSKLAPPNFPSSAAPKTPSNTPNNKGTARNTPFPSKVSGRGAGGAYPTTGVAGLSGQGGTGVKGNPNRRGAKSCYNCGAYDHFQRDCPNNSQSMYGVTDGEEDSAEQEEDVDDDLRSNKQDSEYVTCTNNHAPNSHAKIVEINSASNILPVKPKIPANNNKPIHIKPVRKVKFSDTNKPSATNKQEQVPSPTITADNKYDTKLLVCKMKVFGHTARVLLDGGSQGNFVSSHFVHAKRLRVNRKNNPNFIKMANGKNVEMCDQMLFAKITRPDGVVESQPLGVVTLGFDVVLGKPWLTEHNPQIDWKTNTLYLNGKSWACTEQPKLPETVLSAMRFAKLLKKEKSELLVAHIRFDKDDVKREAQKMHPDIKIKELLRKYGDVFPPDLPKGMPPPREVDHEIKLDTDDPITARGMRRLSPAELEELHKQIKWLLEMGFIRPSKSPFGAQVLFARKKDGTLRLCIDYRALNKRTVKNRYPIPNIGELFDTLAGATVFSSIDLHSAYHQIRIKEEDIPKTAFKTKFGHYEFMVLTFGFTNAPATFQTLMNETLSALIGKGVIVYLDDILIYAKTREEHDDILERVCQLLRQRKLYAKLSKCHFVSEEINFLGHVISAKGIATDPAKTNAIRHWPRPTSVNEVQQFLGLANYYRRFIFNFSKIAVPLTNLTKQTKVFEWDTACEKAFKLLKEKLCSAPVLKLPDFTKPFRVRADASLYALGCELSQEYNGVWHPVCFDSRKLSSAESRYSTYEREWLGIIHALKKWRHYLYGSDITVQTDHLPIVNACKRVEPPVNHRTARWIEFMQEYNCTMQHIAGTKMIVADAISRRPDLMMNGLISSKIGAVDILKSFPGAYSTDKFFNEIVIGVTNPTAKVDPKVAAKLPHYRVENDLLYYDNRLCVPAMVGTQNVRLTILQELHDAPTGTHAGKAKLWFAVRDRFFWPKLYKDVEKFTKSCDVCQRNKPSRHVQGVLQPLPIPEIPWRRVSVDFYTKLPLTKRGHSACMVVICYLSKRAHFIPTRDEATAVETARLFIDGVVKYHGLPEVIVSDRDPKFTSFFWKELFRLLGTKLNMSSTAHPQTDGQSERAIQSLEHMLRCYVNHAQDNWDDFLTQLELGYNSGVHSATGFPPFSLDENSKPLLPIDFLSARPIGSDETTCKQAGEWVDNYKAKLLLAKEHIQQAQEYMKAHFDKKVKDVKFLVGDMVYVSTKYLLQGNISSRPNKSLSSTFQGPFPITEIVSPTVYKLQLPPK